MKILESPASSRPRELLIPDIPFMILLTLSFWPCDGPSLLSNLLGRGHLRSSHPRKLNKSPISPRALLINEVTDPRAPPKVAVKLDKIGPIVFVIPPSISPIIAPIICSAAHRGALTKLPIKDFKKFLIMPFNPPMTLPNKQNILFITPLKPSAKVGFISSGMSLLVNEFIFSSISPKR